MKSRPLITDLQNFIYSDLRVGPGKNSRQAAHNDGNKQWKAIIILRLAGTLDQVVGKYEAIVQSA